MVDLEGIFPRLRGSVYQITSPPTEIYNCIAWAAGDVSRWWWPDPLKKRYWPAGIERDETLAAFLSAFGALGYENCQDAKLEPGFEKIALFAVDEVPQHASRQLPNGRWTSKLGELEDIDHALHDLEGIEYGAVILIMKRSLAAALTA